MLVAVLEDKRRRDIKEVFKGLDVIVAFVVVSVDFGVKSHPLSSRSILGGRYIISLKSGKI